MNIGADLINDADRPLLILVCAASMIITWITNQISQRLLSRQALTSIQFLNKIECIEEFSAKDRVYIHVWVIFGDHCEIFKRFWIFFSFVIGYQMVIILRALFAANNDGVLSDCP